MKCEGGGGEIGWERVRKCRPQWTSISIFSLPGKDAFFYLTEYLTALIFFPPYR